MAIVPESPELTWDIAYLFPHQGQWSDSKYLELTDDLTHLVELTDGRLEILEMPTTTHQQIVLCLIRFLSDFVRVRHLGTALMAPIRVQLRPGMFREPDIVFATSANQGFVRDEYWLGADLVMEVVSSGPKSRRRDLEEKRRDYAAAGIDEYWIIDPMHQSILVLTLVEHEYHQVGEFRSNDIAYSKLIEGFRVPVHALFQTDPTPRYD